MIGLGTIINVDAEKTRQYYQAMGPGEPCSCNNCKNYCARVKAAYPAAAEYLAGLGVEIEKPLETSPLELGADFIRNRMEIKKGPIWKNAVK